MAKILELSGGEEVILDDADYERLKCLNWTYDYNCDYVKRYFTEDGKRKMISMARMVIHVPDGMYVKFINGDKMDHRKGNLTTCTWAEKVYANKKANGKISDFKGVTWDSLQNKWIAQIRVNGKYKTKRLNNEFDAARQYDRWAFEYFGEHAYLNFAR